MNAASADWTRDAFLEQCLERTVFRLHDNTRVSQAIAHAGAGAGRNWMIEARVPVAQVSQLAVLTGHGFQVVDTNVQLDVIPGSLYIAPVTSPEWRIRRAQAADRDVVQELAALYLNSSRFHLDPRIGGQIGARVKRQWVGNFFDGKRGQHMFVVEASKRVSGFLLVVEQETLGIIDLIAIAPPIRGTGATSALVGAWRAASGHLERMLVGTQISNVRSLRAYGRLGFRVNSAMHVLHKHSGEV